MSNEKYTFLRYLSAIHRSTIRYLDIALWDTGLGCGRQFFLTYIYENPGITMYDLAKTGNFDKGTITKAIQKLDELGYVSICPDERDRRVKHLYLTQTGGQFLDRVYETRRIWKEQITRGISPEELASLSALLEKMDSNSREALASLCEKKKKEGSSQS